MEVDTKKTNYTRIELSEKATLKLRKGKAAQVMSGGRFYYIVPFKREFSVQYLKYRVAYLEKRLNAKSKTV